MPAFIDLTGKEFGRWIVYFKTKEQAEAAAKYIYDYCGGVYVS